MATLVKKKKKKDVHHQSEISETH